MKQADITKCAGCNGMVLVGHMTRKKVYCKKCYEIKKGVRDENGQRSNTD